MNRPVKLGYGRRRGKDILLNAEDPAHLQFGKNVKTIVKETKQNATKRILWVV